jgi:hypothetical protein
MPKVIFWKSFVGASFRVKNRDNIRKFYCDVLGGKIMKQIPKGTSFAWGRLLYPVSLWGCQR